ncbi:uncharacterized protein TrAtP1_006350 [Trichoderma atroviride]|uniref:uncharacterized protein n=1 Tax=Hypocrea atroviridis TaxID=63577 RepID=UPI003326D3FB|nr:hypothetical protein TrAtP1_006350 [Trichoderma atroviride]
MQERAADGKGSEAAKHEERVVVVCIREEDGMRERNGSQQSDGLLIKSNEEWCVSRAGEAKGDQRQDSGPSLNSANKPIQHSTNEALPSSRWQKTASPEWTGRVDARRAPGGVARERPAAGRS